MLLQPYCLELINKTLKLIVALFPVNTISSDKSTYVNLAVAVVVEDWKLKMKQRRVLAATLKSKY